MTISVLIIEDQEAYRRLLRHHVDVAFESPVVAEYDPAVQGRLTDGFSASAYDAVLLDDTPGTDAGLDWLRDLSQRPGFPPLIYLSMSPAPGVVDAARAAGAFEVVDKRKIDNARLATALRGAQAARHRPMQELRTADAADLPYRFGDVVIHGYRFVRELSRNPVSSVYLADHERDGTPVVLKVLRPNEGQARGSESFDRFIHEYAIAAGIRHPNIVRIHDFGAADDHAYIVMEYFPLGDLRQRIKAGNTPRQAISYMRQMAQALDALHSQGVLHRDLKPGNVMLRDEDSVVLIDFGMSETFEPDAAITATGEIFGTPYYMSPEQGHGRETDARSDIYSLGVIFYEMLMRRKPYVAGTPMQVIYKHANSPLPELPAELKRYESIVVNCMAKSPSRRYPTAERLVDEMKELEHDEDERLSEGI